MQSMTPDELLDAHPRNFAIGYSGITSMELTRRFFQHQLRFYFSDPSGTRRMIHFNLSRKQVPEARRLLKLASFSETEGK